MNSEMVFVKLITWAVMIVVGIIALCAATGLGVGTVITSLFFLLLFCCFRR